LRNERSSFGYQFLERISNRSLHTAIAVSAATGRNWRRRTFLPNQRVVTIHNGIDPGRFSRRQSPSDARVALNLPRDTFMVVGLGRLDEAKGFADLIDAAALLRAAVPNLLVAIAGEGLLRTPLESLARSRNVDARFLGFQKDVQPVLDAADVFALPSLCEACPYAVLEAMAAGLPALGSDVGGVRELIRHGETGLVLPPRNAPAWAAAIHTLAADAGLRERFGQAGRERVIESFQERDMVRRTFGVYHQLLGR
jgi:glycosyltransferase involved in cell wall biosynthesis